MKKIIVLLAVITTMCSAMNCYTAPAKAIEAVTYTEYNQQKQNEKEFPDPDATYKEVTENDLVFHVYDDYAFLYDCKDHSVTEVTIPDSVQGVQVIGAVDSPFGFCRNLTTITLPDTFQYFDWFDLSCTTIVRLGSTDSDPVPSVSEIVVSETNPYYTVYNGMLYSKDMKTLVGCPPAMDIKQLRISSETERIGDYAFCCTKLETAVIPSNIKHINNSAFAGCENLVSVEIPESITSISGDMFYLCESLSEVTFNGKLERIGYGAFNECNSLTNFVIPETVNCIGANAFENSGCIENENGVHYIDKWVVGSDDDIRTAKLKDNTVGIAELSFFGKRKLEFLDIPESVKYIGDLVFTGLTGVQSTINYRCSYIGERTLVSAKTATDIYIYDSECEIFESEKTIPAVYKYSKSVDDFLQDITVTSLDDDIVTGDVVIHGYAGSTAQAYAEKYDRKFEVIEKESVSGDVNNDGKFNIADAVMLQKYLLNVPEIKLDNWKSADLCGDGRLDVFDLCMMKKMLISEK
ncbi:MAG: leucine-rich repeat protein [Ruminococcus sp.]|nr:leucine-rich repeat protein [Ruminococcus sp.]